MTELEKLNDRLTILRQELATIRTLKTLGYDLKTRVVDWYMNEIHSCVANIKWVEDNNG